jgi:hypothetical protein
MTDKEISEAAKATGTLAFEHGLNKPHDEVWRLVMARAFGGRDIHCVNWFTSEAEAWEFVSKRDESKYKLVSCTKYRKDGGP